MNSFENKYNLITCKYCGNQIAETAKKCPKCGGKNKQTKWGCIFPFLIIGAVVATVGVALFLIDLFCYY